MGHVAWALGAGLRSFFQRPILLLIVLPLGAAFTAWAGAAIVFWDAWMRWAAAALRLDRVGAWINMAPGSLDWIAGVPLAILVFLASLLTALLIIALFAMPVMVGHVGRRNFPGLERRHGGTFLGSLGNALVSLVGYVLALVATLPLWLIPPLAFLIPWVLTTWLNQRLFRYDALAEHASPEERMLVTQRARARLLLLSGIVTLLQFVPVVNLFAPLYAGLCFVHLCLRELEVSRAAKGQRPDVRIGQASASS